jgi:hypothetical protein
MATHRARALYRLADRGLSLYTLCTTTERHERSVITYNRCKDALNDAADRQSVADTAEIYRTYEGSWGSAALIALIPIPIAWLRAYLIVGTVRWVRRGFRPT